MADYRIFLCCIGQSSFEWRGASFGEVISTVKEESYAEILNCADHAVRQEQHN